VERGRPGADSGGDRGARGCRRRSGAARGYLHICTSLIYKWRREAWKSASAGASGFAPVVIEASPSQPAASAGERDVIVVEVKDARVRIGASAPLALITATLKALRS
jgi:transposase-like protein